ncbi:MAG: CDP-alcohol phosphatidyltransferase family protein [Methanolinea sp.]|nr:CDP-alcohol phosphatidyltransferase family protein [Methanolinea sp.]
MNITALRPRFARYIEPVAAIVSRTGLSANQVSVLSLAFGLLCALLFSRGMFLAGSLALLASAILDLVDGSVARQTSTQSRFGAVFDWIVDKYVDALVILGIGISGIPLVSRFLPVAPAADLAVVGLAITGSLMNTFIKPVVYAEIGYRERVDGKIEDPLEGIGFFGRPETCLVLLAGGFSGFIWLSVIVIAACTNLSAAQRITYLYRTFS